MRVAFRRSESALAIAFAFAFASCGRRDAPGDAPTNEEVVDASTPAPAKDAAVASIQAAIARRKASKEIDTTAPDWKNGHVPLRPTAAFDRTKTYVWTVETSEGRVRTMLWADRAPEHVANLVYLALLGFYDDQPLYGLLPGKAVLGGCPVGDGRGSPGYAFGKGPESAAKHDRAGLLSAVSLGPGTDDSKFRWTLAADPSLDGRETVYGEVVQGLDVLRRLADLGTAEGRPSKPAIVRRTSITVR